MNTVINQSSSIDETKKFIKNYFNKLFNQSLELIFGHDKYNNLFIIYYKDEDGDYIALRKYRVKQINNNYFFYERGNNEK